MEFGQDGAAIVRPGKLWTAAESLGRPSPIPALPGVYGWYFDELPGEFAIDGCQSCEGMPLLYVGICPAKPAEGKVSSPGRHLRSRIRSHLRGNSDASTLRFSLGSLLRERLGLRLIPSPSGRLNWGTDGEGRLSAWMAEHARVVWVATPEPWTLEDHLIKTLDLPLNLKGNLSHPFSPVLSAARASARANTKGQK
jgi:hypothetical protein